MLRILEESFHSGRIIIRIRHDIGIFGVFPYVGRIVKTTLRSAIHFLDGSTFDDERDVAIVASQSASAIESHVSNILGTGEGVGGVADNILDVTATEM